METNRQAGAARPFAGIDHPVIAVREMEVARAAFARLGFVIPGMGAHREWGTGNWCIMLEEDYLELRGILDPGRYLHGLDHWLREQGEGLMGLAFATEEAEAVRDWLRGQGFDPPPVRELTRDFLLPERTTSLSFRLCFLRPGDAPGLHSVVFCQHLTPERLRAPEWLEHPNGARRVQAVYGTVPDLGPAEEALGRLFGPEAVRREEDGKERSLRIEAGRGQEILLREDREGASRLEGLVLEVADLEATRAWLRASPHGLLFREEGGGRLVLPGSYACGTEIVFAGKT